MSYNVSFQAPFHLRKEKKNPSPVGKSGILFLSLSPSVSVRVSGYYSVRFMERKEGGDKTEREKEGVGVGGALLRRRDVGKLH